MIGCFNPLKYLSRRNEIVLISIVDGTSVGYVDEMKRYCLAVETHQARRFPYLALMRGFVCDPPGAAAKYYDPQFGRLIQKAAAEWNVDIVELQHLNTACYRPWIRSVPVLLREHNVEYKVWERQAEHADSMLERIYVSSVVPRLKAYEARVAPQFERCITVSEADSSHLRRIAPTAKIEMIPSGVDTEYFVSDEGVSQDAYSMVMTGRFDWQPKRHNLRVLLTELYPRIKAKLPQATLKVVGKGVPDELRELADKLPGVTITGSVPDVRPFLQQAMLALNYLESGGGIALKVLEAMALRKPVLSNTLGCEGIRVQHGENVFLADRESFADAAVFLLENRNVRQRIADGGYQLVKEEYAWERLAGRFHDCYTSVLSENLVATRQGGRN
jgi:polysaccharide biosynthesis protein PslH